MESEDFEFNRTRSGIVELQVQAVDDIYIDSS